MRTIYPASWKEFTDLVSREAANLDSVRQTTQREKEQIDSFINLVQVEATREVKEPEVPSMFSDTVRESIKTGLSSIYTLKSQIANNLKQLSQDYRHAVENEDRFIVLAFGEVNSGKSALANHIAGLDFDLPTELKGICYRGSNTVPRLEEREVECTNEYQGFTLPGLCWIDCPGTLSTTISNSEMAHRLVSRADIILIVSSSDNPIKQSELRELKHLIERSGDKNIDACVAITKVDRFDEDEDENGNLIRKVIKKDRQSWQGQVDWCNEQLSRSGINKYLRISTPIGVSVYVARDRLGRDWVSGVARWAPPIGWDAAYADSGMPDLYGNISNMLKKHGREIKRSWPRKRLRAFRGRIEPELAQTVQAITELKERFQQIRKEIQALKKPLGEEAQEKAASQVAEVLLRHHIKSKTTQFKRTAATEELNQILAASVNGAIKKALTSGGVFGNIDAKMSEALKSFAHKEALELEGLRDKYRTTKYKCTEKSGGIGAGAGQLGGVYAGAELGATIGVSGGPVGVFIGEIIGGVLGGLLGGWGGDKVGRLVYKEDVVVRVKTGTNADEVIAKTTAGIRKNAQRVVDAMIDYLIEYYVDVLIKEIHKMKKLVLRWERTIQTIS